MSRAAKQWTMTAEHAQHAEQHPPREGYTCGAHAETFGGGCFNCGWKKEKPMNIKLLKDVEGSMGRADERLSKLMSSIDSARDKSSHGGVEMKGWHTQLVALSEQLDRISESVQQIGQEMESAIEEAESTK